MTSRASEPPHPIGTRRGERTYRVPAGGGVELLVEEFGTEGTPHGAVFAHGFGLDRSDWHYQMAAPGGNRRFVFYDARGHGSSTAVGAGTTTQVLASDLKAVLDATRLTRAVLVGHSMGSMTVLEVCRRFPETLGGRVAGLVVASATASAMLETFTAARILGSLERRRRIVGWLLADPRRHAWARLRRGPISRMIVALFGFGRGADPAQVEHVRRLLEPFPTPGLVGILKDLIAFDLGDTVERIDVPVVVVTGSRDRIVEARGARDLAARLPRGRLVVFEGAGHMAIMERHPEFNRLLAAFLDEVLGPPSGGPETAPPREAARG